MSCKNGPYDKCGKRTSIPACAFALYGQEHNVRHKDTQDFVVSIAGTVTHEQTARLCKLARSYVGTHLRMIRAIYLIDGILPAAITFLNKYLSIEICLCDSQ